MVHLTLKITTIAVLLLAVAGSVFISQDRKPASRANTQVPTNVNVRQPVSTRDTLPPSDPTNVQEPLAASTLVVPVTGFFDRITKKPFGIYITPKTSPIQPEKFTGYHTGADAETIPAEQATDIPVFSIAVGTVAFVGHVNGYGGVLVIRHSTNGKTVTCLYGHIRLTSVTVKAGESVAAGQKVAVLGTGFTSETDGERRHLHLSLHAGSAIDYRGYVQKKGELSTWLDPVQFLRNSNATEPY